MPTTVTHNSNTSTLISSCIWTATAWFHFRTLLFPSKRMCSMIKNTFQNTSIWSIIHNPVSYGSGLNFHANQHYIHVQHLEIWPHPEVATTCNTTQDPLTYSSHTTCENRSTIILHCPSRSHNNSSCLPWRCLTSASITYSHSCLKSPDHSWFLQRRHPSTEFWLNMYK